MFYKDKRVLITGGANGIGREIARSYAALGAIVIVADKDYKGEQFVAQELQPLHDQSCFYHVDLSSSKSCEEMMRWIFGRYDDLDIIINNASVTDFGNLTEMTVERWDYILGTNLRAPFIICRDFAINRQMKGYKDQYGRIINIASTRYLMSEEGTEGYTASKGGLVALTHGLAISFSGYRVTVNCISPGWICCEGYEDLKYSDHRQHPSGRVGKPMDVVKACLYFTDENNDFLNGENLVLDGGMTRKMIYVD